MARVVALASHLLQPGVQPAPAPLSPAAEKFAQGQTKEWTVRHGSLAGVVPMGYAEPLSEALVEAYLVRLGVPRPSQPNLETLTALLAAHVDRICYENIDLKLGKPVCALDPASSAARVALQRRGGYCFILVDAFAALLSSLGYTVSLHTSICEIVRPLQDEKWGAHVVAVVHLEDGAYIADVGLGEGPRSPIRLATDDWSEDGFPYSLQEWSQGEWSFNNPANVTGILPGFTVDLSTSVSSMHEFSNFHQYFWAHQDSGYVKGPIFMHRKTEGRGVLSIIGCTLRRSHPELPGKGYEVLATAATREEWFALVHEHFFLSLDELSEAERDQLWAQLSADHDRWLAKQEAREAD
mmetsp:Transcript_27153/g.68939  ORF Transcript_27153/g.68939 Transcript_27153/m.68939 type:complete len:353 (+) Transcript_27153:56-1114(+)|eukprot:CAMPEP_0195067526 /NCGR_PEP_ID=MMETSP0448-20130528/12551_1 /TAXON_ID=66468 /ORGANISM="Heterocapsa triquestra, Strain CCMP 448" /LENGTH=352 /DNA_ID=CAMNT_0040098947 /DNA_START=45 /DNA_END=1103 /DNA_ORIENTATION=+